MTQRQFILGLLVALLVFALIGAAIVTGTYLQDRERDSKERLQQNRPRKIWERK